MLKRSLYNIGFTVVMCAVCAVTVTFANSRWGPIYKANLEAAKTGAIVEALGLVEDASDDRGAVADAYGSFVRPAEGERVPTYKAVRGGRVIGYAIEIEGRGYEGTVHGVLALEPDRLRIKGFRIYEHEEAPVGRCTVDSRRFANRFEGKWIIGPDDVPGIRLVKHARARNEIDAIVGATRSSEALQRLLTNVITEFLSGRKLVKLGLSLPESVAVPAPAIPSESTAKPLSAEPRGSVMVPEGTELLSRGKPVTGSEEEPIIGELEQITDGEKSAEEGGYVELGMGEQYVQIDLGETYELAAVVIWRDYRSPKIYRDVVVQTADDADFERNVKTLFNSDRNNSLKLGPGKDIEYVESYEGKLVRMKGTRARFVRVHSNENFSDNMNRYAEIEVYGKTPGEEGAEDKGRKKE